MIVDLNQTAYRTPPVQALPPYARPGMGAFSLPNLGSLDWRWLLALAVGGLLLWRLLGRSSRAERRRQLRLARARYQMELAKA